MRINYLTLLFLLSIADTSNNPYRVEVEDWDSINIIMLKSDWNTVNQEYEELKNELKEKTQLYAKTFKTAQAKIAEYKNKNVELQTEKASLQQQTGILQTEVNTWQNRHAKMTQKYFNGRVLADENRERINAQIEEKDAQIREKDARIANLEQSLALIKKL